MSNPDFKKMTFACGAFYTWGFVQALTLALLEPSVVVASAIIFGSNGALLSAVGLAWSLRQRA